MFLYFAVLLLSGCSTAKNDQIAEVPFSTIQTYIASSEGSVDLVRGGGITRRLKQDRRFENLRLYLVPETNIVVRQEYYLIISATSTEGKAV